MSFLKEKCGTIFQKSVQLLAYARDIDIIGGKQPDVSGAFARIDTETAKMGLTANEGKTMYMLSTRRFGQKVTLDRYNFEVAKTTTPALRPNEE